jgi:hypothetical protein
MEDVLDLYAEPVDPARPVVCVDEYPLALTAPTREPLPLKPTQPARQDYEYRRCGSCSLFGAFQPRAAWRTIQVRDRRTAQDFAHLLQTLVDEHFPQATTIRLVLDNLNTHHPGVLYDTFPAAEARRLARTLEFHYTPPHGSWLNMLEIEWSVLAQQCLGRHLPDLPTVQAEVDAWATQRNQQQATVRWYFVTPDARRAMQTLYPNVSAADPPEQPSASAPTDPVRTLA